MFSNTELCVKACEILINKLGTLSKAVQDDSVKITNGNSTLPFCYEVVLSNMGYTIGKVIEYILHKDYYQDSKLLSYVGFQKTHPHKNDSIIRLAYKEQTDKQMVSKNLISACERAIGIYSTILDEFNE